MKSPSLPAPGPGSLPPFEAIYREFRPRVLRYLGRFVSEDEAADLAQVTLIKVSEHLAEFRGESSLSTWIYRIATNVARDRLRQVRPHADMGTIDAEGACGEGVPRELQADSTELTVLRAEMSGCVREFVDRLPESYRTVLVLSDIEGLTNEEIAGIVGSSVGTVKIRLHRARQRLRSELRAGCTFEHGEGSELACDRKPVAFRK